MSVAMVRQEQPSSRICMAPILLACVPVTLMTSPRKGPKRRSFRAAGALRNCPSPPGARQWIRCLLPWLVLILLTACGMPHDPAGTLKKVTGDHRLRAGAIENPPFVQIHDSGEVTGAEAEIVRLYAKELGTEIEWIPGAGTVLMEALGKRELDLVIGGLTAKTPWKKHVATSRSYLKTAVRVGVPPGAEPLRVVKDHEVAVDAHSPSIAMYVREKGGIPRLVPDLYARLSSGTPLPVLVRHLPVAAEEWRLESWGYTTAGEKLHTEKHVLALPQGENAWIVRTDRFLSEKLGKGEAEQLLQKFANPQEMPRRP